MDLKGKQTVEKGMIAMLNRLMTSRKVRGFLLILLIVSALVAVVSVAVPLNRKKEEKPAAPATPPADVQLLTEIRDLLKEKK